MRHMGFERAASREACALPCKVGDYCETGSMDLGAENASSQVDLVNKRTRANHLLEERELAAIKTNKSSTYPTCAR